MKSDHQIIEVIYLGRVIAMAELQITRVLTTVIGDFQDVFVPLGIN